MGMERGRRGRGLGSRVVDQDVPKGGMGNFTCICACSSRCQNVTLGGVCIFSFMHVLLITHIYAHLHQGSYKSEGARYVIIHSMVCDHLFLKHVFLHALHVAKMLPWGACENCILNMLRSSIFLTQK